VASNDFKEAGIAGIAMLLNNLRSILARNNKIYQPNDQANQNRDETKTRSVERK